MDGRIVGTEDGVDLEDFNLLTEVGDEDEGHLYIVRHYAGKQDWYQEGDVLLVFNNSCYNFRRDSWNKDIAASKNAAKVRVEWFEGKYEISN